MKTLDLVLKGKISHLNPAYSNNGMQGGKIQ